MELAQAILHPEEDDSYPKGIRDSAARRAIYDYLDHDTALAISIDHAIRISATPDWHANFQRSQKIRVAIYKTLKDAAVEDAKANELTEGIFDLAKRHDEYER